MRSRVLHWVGPTIGLSGALFVFAQASSLAQGRPFALGSYSSLQFVLNTNAAALASTLGILMAIVLLMVQLTAQRYSFNIIGEFVRNPRNVALVSLFIFTISFNLWLSASITEDHSPQAGSYLALGLGTICFGLLVPYFAYLFDTLTPHNLLNALHQDALDAIESVAKGRPLPVAQQIAAEKVQYIGDIARTAVSLSDADVARHSVWVLYGMFCDYMERKAWLPLEWFTTAQRFFQGRHQLVIEEIQWSRTWLEWRVFEELQVAFVSSLNKLEPVSTAVALCYRRAGEEALTRGDDAALRLLMKFFNTVLRAALNARDARAGYHLLYQYALLAEAALETRPEITREIARRIAYYGETAIGTGVLWMAIAAGQDLRTLAEASVRAGMPVATVSEIQRQLLELVQTADSREDVKRSPTASLLRKAVLALGGFHLENNQDELARELAQGLRQVYPRQLVMLVNQLMEVVEPNFWELTDRVVNFEYVEAGPRARLSDFLALAIAESDLDEDQASADLLGVSD